MLLVIKNVLDKNQLKVMAKLLQDAEFATGIQSAGKEAARVKNNLELSQQTRTEEVLHQQLNQMLMPSLLQHSNYQNSVYPLKVATPFYVRYDKGMHYDFHVDDPIMGAAANPQERYRSDVSTTVFLNDDYTGGELIIKTSTGEVSIKAQAGDAVVYSSHYLHKVNEVTSGSRMVAVTWAQSMVKDSAKREMLYELSQARDSLLATNDSLDESSNAESTLARSQISNVYTNLLRRWSDL